MKRKSDFLKKIIFFVVWIFSTVISVALAYWLVGAIPKTDEELGYFTRLLHVLQNPFAFYFNEYTPIGMVLAFIVTELLFGFILILKMIANPYTVPEEDGDPEKWNTLKPEIKEGNGKGELQIEFVETQNTETSEVSEKDKKGKNVEEKDDDENEIFLREDMFLKLFNSGYTMSQINAMMELTTYIPNIDVQQMTKMFKPSMNENEIRGYIETFFG